MSLRPVASSGSGLALIGDWQPAYQYLAGQVAKNNGRTWIARDLHTSSSTFTADQDLHWDVLVGGTSGLVQLTLTGAPIAPNAQSLPWVAPIAGTLLGVAGDSDGYLTLDVRRNGVTIFTTQANRPAMTPPTGYVALERTPDLLTFAPGDKFTIHAASLAHSSRDWQGTSSVSNSSAVTNPTVSIPTPTQGVAVGDILLTSIKVNTADTTATTIAAPTGFVEIGTGIARSNSWEMHVFWKRADSTDAAASTFAHPVTGTISGYLGTMTTYRNLVASGSPIDAFATTAPTFTSSLTVPAQVPATADDLRVVFVGTFSGQTSSVPSSMTLRSTNVFDRNLTGLPATSSSDVVPLSSTNYAGAISVLLKAGVVNDTTSYGHASLRYLEAVTSTGGSVVTDTVAPTVPGSVTATALSATQVKIQWTASTDAVGVTGYRIKRGGVVLKNVAAVTSAIDASTVASTAYVYTVEAFDAAGNFSAAGTAPTVTTPAATVGGTGAYTIDGIYMRDPAGNIFTPYGFNMGVSQSIGANFASDESVVNSTNGTPHTAELLEWGCNCVRMFVYVSDSTSWINTLGRTNAWNKIKAAIDLYRAAGFVVIVSPADMTGANAGRVADHEEDTVEFLGTVGAAYASDSGVWWGANEPAVSLVAGRSGDYNTDWLAVHNRMYNALRVTAGNPNIYVMDGPGAAQDPGPTQVAGLKRVYDADMGPAFIAGKSNVLFGLHNYGWQAGPSSPLSSYISAYTTYLTNVHNAGLAMYIGEADTLLNSRPEVVVNDDRRHRYGFQASVQLADQFAVGLVLWFGTSVDLTGPKYDRNAGNSQGRPWWWGGSSSRLSDSGARFWNMLHPTEPVPVALPYPSLDVTTYSAGTVLTANPGTWTDGGTLSYEWRRTIGSTHTPIGTNSPTYTATVADIGTGYRLSCVVVNTNSVGSGAEDTGYATSA